MIVDDIDGTLAVEAAARLSERLAQMRDAAVVPAAGETELTPPFSAARDHYQGRAPGLATLLVYGAYGTPASRSLGRILEHVREEHPSTVCVAWRHLPDPPTATWPALLALAAEAGAARGHFWAITRELLAMRHDDADDLHRALLRAGLDPRRAVDAMGAGVGADRIAEDVASAVASGVETAPALFLNGGRYRGELDHVAVSAAIAAELPS
jgi:hypothetical protein